MSDMAELAAEVRSLREHLNEFVEAALEGQSEVSTEKLVRMAYKHFEDNEWVREALIREGLIQLMPVIASDVRHAHRTRARLAKTNGEHRRERIASVFEHVGLGVSKSVLAMNRRDHLFAAGERETAAAGHLRWAGFHRAIASLHKDDRTVTADLPSEKVAELWRTHIERDTSIS